MKPIRLRIRQTGVDVYREKKYLLFFIVSLLCFLNVGCAKFYYTNEFIPFALNKDYNIAINHTYYQGYIRFEQVKQSRLKAEKSQICRIIIALQFEEECYFLHNVGVELFDEEHNLIGRVLLLKDNFAPMYQGYSYNTIDLRFNTAVAEIKDVKYFRYHFLQASFERFDYK